MAEFRPFKDCFELSDEIRPSHLLWEDFLKERTDLSSRDQKHKMMFYMLLFKNEINAQRGIAADGNHGFGLKYLPKT